MNSRTRVLVLESCIPVCCEVGGGTKSKVPSPVIHQNQASYVLYSCVHSYRRTAHVWLRSQLNPDALCSARVFLLNFEVPDDNFGWKALVPLISCLLWEGYCGQNLASSYRLAPTRPDWESGPHPSPTSLKTELATKFVEEWKKKLQIVWKMVTGPRRVKQNLSKENWGQKQLSKR